MSGLQLSERTDFPPKLRRSQQAGTPIARYVIPLPVSVKPVMRELAVFGSRILRWDLKVLSVSADDRGIRSA